VIHWPWDIRERSVDGVALEFTPFWIDQVDLAGVPASEQRIEIELPHPELGQVGGDADHRYRTRLEHEFKRVKTSGDVLWHPQAQSLV